MAKRTVRLTESELKKIISESVNKILNESLNDFSILNGKWNVTINNINNKEHFHVVIDCDTPYISIGGWEGFGDEAIETISDIYNYYEGDVKAAIAAYIKNY
jgi:hypothetical protein